MYTTDELLARFRVRPFIPVRMSLSNGETYDIYHPDLVMVGRRDVTIGLPMADNPAAYEQQVRVALVHIHSLRDLPVPAAPPA